MKKLNILLLLASSFLIVGCGANQTSSSVEASSSENVTTSSSSEAVKETFNAIMPYGTPSLGVATFIKDNRDNCEIVNGSDPLVAALKNASYDIVVAPVNLGAKFYNTNATYQLYETFVWGNTYIASLEPLTTFQDLDGVKVTCYGANSTPDIVLRSLETYYDIDIDIEYVDDVSTANTQLIAGTSKVIVSAEPALSKIKSNKTVYTIDLQEEWNKAFGVKSYPQAGIFVHKDKASSLTNTLQAMKNAVLQTMENPSQAAQAACDINEAFATLGEEVLTSSIPNCHYGFSDNQKAAVDSYFNQMNSLGLSAGYGGNLPDENFYFTF
ncbi:MAG: MqnA/MqnD/SBP family protein [Bacilli bacterium]